MPGLVPGIHVFLRIGGKKDMDAGTSPAMTTAWERVQQLAFDDIFSVRRAE